MEMEKSNFKDVVKAWLDGEAVEFKSGDDWLTKSAYDGSGGIEFYGFVEYRIKPRTIRIGAYDVPEPVRTPLKEGEQYFTLYLSDGGSAMLTSWDGSEFDTYNLKGGLIHLSREAAELHAKALISLTRVKP